ncbi:MULTISPECIES: carbohydrate ABC transporter permease [Hungatella]|uniref:Raffinose/stachyose/melibiose transport system permease protein n=2 Tax=Hungatella TaxID=1649459 RepID=A0A2V3XUT3_9FIRM|nr:MULTISPECIES: carbohydrate ABC transporter permease [Hungatella]MBC5712082.1 carbohydrate ABC transporter permease [Hungatella hominis]PXX45549.1 raffinose/stachyose/melibiose transport system permease protein [Hungatella effluvii]
MKKKNIRCFAATAVGVVSGFIIFVIPFLFMLVNSLKDRKSANQLRLSLPESVHFENFLDVIKEQNYMLLRAYKNSFILAFFSILLLVVFSSMAGYVLQRRSDRKITAANAVILVGLMVPPAIMPTIWVLQSVGLYKTMVGMILIEVALHTPFTVMLYRGFMASIPIELEDAGYIDGCSQWKMFWTVVFPLLKPVSATVTILNMVSVFNDFMNPLYFLPGTKNVTLQLTLYSFMGQFSSSYNLLFADVILIVLPMLIIFFILNDRIVDGMTAGAVKG